MPSSSTKRRGRTSGRQSNSGPSNYPSSRSRPGVHPIIPTRTSDQVTGSRPKTDQPKVDQPKVDPKIEQQEMLEALDTNSKAPDQFTPRDDVIDKYVEEDLGLIDPDSQPQPASTVATSFSPTIGRPDKTIRSRSDSKVSGSPSSDRSGTSTSSRGNSADTVEKQRLSDIMNQEKASLQKNLQSKSDKLKSQKISGWNFRGKIKSRLKRVILGLVIAGLVAVPIAAIGIIPHAIQSWIANRTSVYVERAAEQMGKKMLFTFFRDRVAVGKCKEFYSARKNVAGIDTCRPRLNERDGRLAQLFNDWQAAKMEGALVENGIEVQYDYDELNKSGKPYRVIIDGENRFLSDLTGKDWDFSEFTGRRETSNILNRQMKKTLKQKTNWWQFMKRRNMKAGYLRDLDLPKRFFGSDERAKKRDEAEIKRNKKYSRWRQHLTKHVVNVGKGRVAFLIEILFEGNSALAEDKQAVIDNNRTLRKLADKIGDDEVIKLLNKFAGKDLKQISKQVILDLIEKIFGKAVKKGAQSAATAIPVVGWILLAFTIFDLLDMATDGTLQKYISVQNAQSMMDMSNLMDTTISEERRGYVDADSAGDLRLSLIKGMPASRVFSNTVGYKSPKDKQAEGYNCKPNVSVSDINSVLESANAIFGGGDPNALPQTGMEDGQDVCKNHRVDYDPLEAFNMSRERIQELLEPYTVKCAIQSFIPGWMQILDFATSFFGCPTGTTQEVYHKFNDVIGWFIDIFEPIFKWAAGLPLVKELTQLGVGWLTNAITLLITGNTLAGAELLQGGLKTDTKSGARIFDSWSGGQQAIQNDFAKGVGDGGGLGLVAQTPAQTSALNRSIAQERKEQLASASVFERMFDMSNVDTLASGFSAVALTEGGFSNFVNPFNNIALAFNTASPSAFAGNDDQEYCIDANRFGKAVTEFGIVCYAIADDNIIDMSEEDMVQYSDPDFCESYTSDLDAELKEKELEDYWSPNQDPDGSGQATKPNYCRLMCSVTDTMGTNFRTNDKICGFEKYAAGSSAGDSDDNNGGGGDGGNNDQPVIGDTSSTPCKEGSNDAGEAEGWSKGEKYNIRLCTVDGFRSTSSEDTGLARFNSTVSGNVVRMIAAAKAKGLDTVASSSFRSYAKQAELYACAPGCTGGNPAAPPGRSNHQMGFAFDISSKTAFHGWMKNNVGSYGYKWFGPGDKVHFSTTGN